MNSCNHFLALAGRDPNDATLAGVEPICHASLSEPTNKGVNRRLKDVTQTQQQRPESPTVTLRAEKQCGSRGGRPGPRMADTQTQTGRLSDTHTRTHARTHTHARVHARTHTHRHACTNTYTHACKRTHIHIYARTHTRLRAYTPYSPIPHTDARLPARTQTCKHTHRHARTHPPPPPHTQTRAREHTHTHTHTDPQKHRARVGRLLPRSVMCGRQQ